MNGWMDEWMNKWMNDEGINDFFTILYCGLAV